MRLKLSEIMTIMIMYHHSGFKTFKDYYVRYEFWLRSYFPKLVSYTRFVELQTKAALPMLLFVQLVCKSSCTGISFIDSFCLKVSHIRRASSHKVFKNIAQKGKTSVGWFYGFKVHFVMNQYGEVVEFCITSGNVADNNHSVIMKLFKNIFGKVFGDKGYLLAQELIDHLHTMGIDLITKVRSNMKKRFIDPLDARLLQKRGAIESAIAIMKDDLLIEHSRHRSPVNFISYIASSLTAYAFRRKKPSIAFEIPFFSL